MIFPPVLLKDLQPGLARRSSAFPAVLRKTDLGDRPQQVRGALTANPNTGGPKLRLLTAMVETSIRDSLTISEFKGSKALK